MDYTLEAWRVTKVLVQLMEASLFGAHGLRALGIVAVILRNGFEHVLILLQHTVGPIVLIIWRRFRNAHTVHRVQAKVVLRLGVIGHHAVELATKDNE